MTLSSPKKIQIKVDIQRHIEGGIEYFLATSKDLPSLLVEGESVEKVRALVPDIAKDLIRLEYDPQYRSDVFSAAGIGEYSVIRGGITNDVEIYYSV